jgi:hypothetical protein
LYDKEIAQNAGLEQNHSNGEKKSISQSSHSSSSAQTPASIVSRKYGDGISVNGNASEQEAFDQFKAKTGKAPASKDELRNWLTSQRNVTEPATVAG